MIFGTVSGNLGRDAEVRDTQAGKVCSFSVACSKKIRGTETTTWVRCSIWGERGEKLAGYLTKGTKVVVVGELSLREYEGKTNLECRVAELEFGGGQRGERRKAGPAPADPRNAADPDDDIQF